jgi:LPXTG-motif cell wall-anchored protein
MKVFTKRNALLGFLSWRVGKRMFRRRAHSLAPTVEGGKPNKPAIVAALAALGGVLFFWRKRRRGGDVAEDDAGHEDAGEESAEL